MNKNDDFSKLIGVWMWEGIVRRLDLVENGQVGGASNE
jgi:hypothetical protein